MWSGPALALASRFLVLNPRLQTVKFDAICPVCHSLRYVNLARSPSRHNPLTTLLGRTKFHMHITCHYTHLEASQ